VPIEAKVGLGSREPDQHRVVDAREERIRLQDARHVEPHVGEPDPLAWVDAIDAKTLGGGRPEDGNRLVRRCRVEEPALRDGGTHRLQEAEAGGVDRQRVGLHGGDEGAAVDIGIRRTGGLDLGDRANASDHPGRGGGQLGRLAREEVLAGLNGEQVGPEPVDLADETGRRGRRQPEHSDDGRHPDRDAQGGQGGAELAGAQPYGG
jgi:hypothetical protein